MVVEDEPNIALALCAGFEEEGWTTVWADRGDGGLEIAKTSSFDAIVLDVLLPGLNGYLLCAELRAASIWTPVVMLTAKDGENDEIEGLDWGADDYLTKPFSYPILTARIRSVVRRGSSHRPTILTSGPVVLDPAERTCSVEGEAVPLTRREFAMLEHLMRHAGRPVSREEIHERVFGGEEHGKVNVVHVYAGYLRRKLGPNGAAVITTVRGAGYLVPKASADLS